MATFRSRIVSEDRRQQILEVATELFARGGFNGTTTREIAQQANVNEAIIFRHFPTKDDLYWAVLENKCTIDGGKSALRKLLASTRGEREVFEAIAKEYWRRRGEDPSMTRLLFFSALERHELSERFFRTHVAEYYETLAEYIRQRIASRRFRNVDARLAARAYLSMVTYHFLLQDLLGGRAYQHYDHGESAKVIADIWLEGMWSQSVAKSGGGNQKVTCHNRSTPAASATGVGRGRNI
jgi:AcrR family transcriptional regulator